MIQPMTSRRFSSAFRLRAQSDFDRVYARRASAADDVLLVYACDNGLQHPRIGLSVSRKVGNAVKRNSWKRILREAFRLSIEQLPRGVDLVVIPRAPARPTLVAASESMVRLAQRASKKLRRE
jgi:ribonuclease P protein component